jgi:uncharacterized cupin superfamily protein
MGEFQPGVGRAIGHTHDREHNVFYVLSGRATAKVGGHEYSLEPGDLARPASSSYCTAFTPT